MNKKSILGPDNKKTCTNTPKVYKNPKNDTYGDASIFR